MTIRGSGVGVAWVLGSLVYAGCAPDRLTRDRPDGDSRESFDGGFGADGGTRTDGSSQALEEAGVPDADATDARADSRDGSSALTDSAADSGSQVNDAAADGRCVPRGDPDFPDEDFSDTNCDGIDGDESQAIFVSPSGLDGNPGTRGAPVRTIQVALNQALTWGKSSVYVCTGLYRESLRLTGQPVHLFGGFDCNNDWRRGPGPAVINPERGVPLTVQNVSGAVMVSRLLFQAANTPEPDQSSIAVSVIDSAVEFFRAEFVAGDAGNGSPGAQLPDVLLPAQDPAADALHTGITQCFSSGGNCTGTITGANCTLVSKGAVGPARTCDFDLQSPIRGGNGGDGANCSVGAPAQSGSLGLPSGPSGERGSDGADGAPALRGFGELLNGQYVASNSGKAGEYGRPGFAGRGGNGNQSVGAPSGGQFNVGGGGGQGGYPGCPGRGGHPGRGGGASIGIVAIRSGVILELCKVTTGRGGAGGLPSSGLRGQPGGPGGKGASGPGMNGGQTGMPGGDGGRGGAGGPGGGGPSIGVAYTGVPPVMEGTTFIIGDAGLGAAVNATTKGADGVREAIYTDDTVAGGP